MTHGVVRGEPYKSQLYLDEVLDEVLKEKGIYDINEREKVSLPQLLYHCISKYPDELFMINGSTGAKITKSMLLRQAVSIARTLLSKGAKGKTVMVVMRNHQYQTATYLGVLFAETQPFMMDPNTTVFELVHFLNLIEPSFVFCDEEHYDDLKTALQQMSLEPEVIIGDGDEKIKNFAKESGDEALVLPDAAPDSPVIMLPTSGSTGFPKTAQLTNRGLILQTAVKWAYHTVFPKPTELVMILTTQQWVTFNIMLIASIVYRIPVLISPQKPTVEHVQEMLVKYRPTWTFFGPAFLKTLLPTATNDHFSSLETLILLGAPSSTELLAELREKLPKSTHLSNGLGATEAQGPICLPDREAPMKSNGRVVNIFHYKLIDDDGKSIGLCSIGELYIKSKCTIKGYYRNEAAYKEAFIDGWYRTGDLFYIDENERLTFVERRKFSFKFRGCQVAPEEVESVIDSVTGVEHSVVCETEDGPAAAVIVRPNCKVTREMIHEATEKTLSEHKRLHGGIVFVSSLPHTHSGKISREDCKKLIIELKKIGECHY